MRALTCIALSVLLLAAPAGVVMGFGGFGGGPEDADDGPDLWSRLDFKPVVGHWAEYEMKSKGEETVRMKFAIVGKEDDAHWLESTITGEDGEQMINKMLVTGEPGDMDNVKRMIAKMGDRPAMEMPIEMMKMGGMGQEEQEEPETKITELGTESVTVPAGTFEAKRLQFAYDGKTFDTWLKTGVGPYGLVKGSDEEFSMVLVGYGDKAVSQITEEPMKMPQMGGPGGGMPGQ